MTEADELLKERVEEARTTFDRNVALTMAILAVLLATDSLFGHRAHTEELLEQAQASDQWAYYQAKTIRRAIYDVGAELARVTHDTPPQASQSIVTTFRDRAARYEQESKAIEERAREFEHGRDRYRRLADRFDLAEIFLEVSIVMCSLAILTKRRSVWLASGAIGITGVLVALTALRLH